MAQQETLVGEDELDALMDQLEAETKGMVAAPAAVKPAAPPPPTEDDLAGLEDELAEVSGGAAAAGELLVAGGRTLEEVAASANAAGVVSTDDTVALEQARLARAETEVAAIEAHANDPDAAMAELEAELAASIGKGPAAAAPAPVPEVAIAAPVEPEKVLTAPAVSARPRVVPGGGDGPVKPEPAIPVARVEPVEEVEHPNPPPKARPPVTPGTPIDVAAFRDETRVSETNLDTCMMEQAGLFAYWASVSAQSEAAAARLKVQVEIAEAKLYDRHRKALATSGEKVTEKMVENAVRLDPQYGAIHAKLIDAESVAAVAKGLVESLKQRRDMIIQLGADRREEGKGAARIVAAAQSHADLKDRAAAAARR